MNITVTDIVVQILLTYLGLAGYFKSQKKDDIWSKSFKITAALCAGVLLCFLGVGGIAIAIGGNIVLIAFLVGVHDIKDAVKLFGIITLCELVVFGLIRALI